MIKISIHGLNFKKHQKLSNWCRGQRERYHDNNLPQKRIQLLEVIGFKWDLLPDLQWEEMYQKLAEHKSRTGTIQLSSNKNSKLGV